MKRKRVGNESGKYAIFGDIQFPRDSPLADYGTIWDRQFIDRKLITVLSVRKVRYFSLHGKVGLILKHHYAINSNVRLKIVQATVANCNKRSDTQKWS